MQATEYLVGSSQPAPKVNGIGLSAADILQDYRTGYKSRQASLLGRKEVLTGKAKFGIFGDGKEVAQLAMARAFQPGDIRSGYYRDQTLAFATGMMTIREFFAQLYSDTEDNNDPASAGRQMNAHFATPFVGDDGQWLNLKQMRNSSADCSPTASQMPRMVGLAYASKLYRLLPELAAYKQFSDNGNEIVFGTIGDASTSEGLFWETMNAVGVLQVPLLMSVWDDNYGISVPIRYQTSKSSISAVMAGFHPDEFAPNGVEIYTVKGWDYLALVNTYSYLAARVRQTHCPALLHVQELTQPQGHSTSGSHERYKSKERLEWERQYDCLTQMRLWMINNNIIAAHELDALEEQDRHEVLAEKQAAWNRYQASIKADIQAVSVLLSDLAANSTHGPEVESARRELEQIKEPFRKDVYIAIGKGLVATAFEPSVARDRLLDWKSQQDKRNFDRFNSHLHSQTPFNALQIQGIKAEYPENPQIVDGRQILQACFDAILARDPRVCAFGEDVGFLGDVNQAFAGMQQKYGEYRVTDTGIREATIIGQGIGLAMRGLRPIAEIQYLDYLLYATQIISDDLATLNYRTKGKQRAPLIIRTRGHRLEGVWHSGSPMGMIINAFRGVNVLVPRNMTQAAGFYNTMLKSDEPALIIEVLNGYRLKEPMPSNIDTFCVPVGVPEIIRPGRDLTLITYGACCRIATEAAELLTRLGIEVEVIDVQSLLPFDRYGVCVASLKRTNRILFLDEDVPGGASAFMMQQVLEVQGGYRYLDSPPKTLTAHPHRPAYATDGDYFSKPGVEHVIEAVTNIMHEFNPTTYPRVYNH